MFEKLFIDWIRLKAKLHNAHHKPPAVSEGEMWWASLGENIGGEINGKSDKFTRPVIIYRKLSRNLYCVIPTTTQPREGSWFIPFTQRGKKSIACLHQIRTIDYRRLWSKIGELDGSDFRRVKNGFKGLYT